MSSQEQTTIQYIGRREFWSDRLYGTGLVFKAKQKRALPAPIARKLLRHVDLFNEVESDAGKEADKAPKDDAPKNKQASVDDTQQLLDEQAAKNKDKEAEQNELTALYDTVNTMDKDQLKEFAQTHYQQKINRSKSVENLRIEVNGMIDRFGVV